ncbi:hypothetical protein IU449_27640 [Nocardia higoensis]|uniref:Replication protein n=1 Tax=Nocardia higoensis TaxID=228599 RepID=A0ABS0DIJ3_9NOCA|nr:hypothetical protein [Nocardia higoensis]MBF6358275.1 hypothetical protein [Nocardia higoensis]
MVEAVARKTFEAYLLTESAGADYHTGRDARVSLARLQAATHRQRSTVLRCRRLTRKLGTRTTVFTGRHRTREERLDSHKRQDRSRGWASVAALHESVVLPVDNSHVEKLLDQGFGTPPERSEGSSFLSRQKSVTSPTTMRDRASRCLDKSGRRRTPRAYDQRAVKLVARMHRDERFPLWVRMTSRGQLTAVVTRKAVAGWDVDDIYGALEEVRIGGRAPITRPDNPAGYLSWLLRQIPDDVPPARLDRAREVAATEVEHATWRRELEQMRQARTTATGMNAAARATRDALATRTHGQAAARAREAEQARRELAQKARNGR